MTGKLSNAQNSAVINLENRPNMQCQRKHCLMDIHSETQPNSLQQLTIQKQGSINSVWWSATCGW